MNRFPSEIIQQAIWLYLRFTLSFRDVEDLLAERGFNNGRRGARHRPFVTFGRKSATALSRPACRRASVSRPVCTNALQLGCGVLRLQNFHATERAV